MGSVAAEPASVQARPKKLLLIPSGLEAPVHVMERPKLQKLWTYMIDLIWGVEMKTLFSPVEMTIYVTCGAPLTQVPLPKRAPKKTQKKTKHKEEA